MKINLKKKFKFFTLILIIFLTCSFHHKQQVVISTDYDQAHFWFHQSIEQQNDSYHIKGIQLLKQACIAHEAKACYELGIYYHYGFPPMEKSIELAINFYQVACLQNEAVACLNLASIYEEDEQYKDISKAIIFNTKACKLYHTEGCHNNAYHYELGKDIKTNYKEVIYFEKLACDLKDIEGCLYLVKLFSKGQFITPDKDMALYYKIKACELDHQESCNNSNEDN